MTRLTLTLLLTRGGDPPLPPTDDVPAAAITRTRRLTTTNEATRTNRPILTGTHTPVDEPPGAPAPAIAPEHDLTADANALAATGEVARTSIPAPAEEPPLPPAAARTPHASAASLTRADALLPTDEVARTNPTALNRTPTPANEPPTPIRTAAATRRQHLTAGTATVEAVRTDPPTPTGAPAAEPPPPPTAARTADAFAKDEVSV